MIQQKDMLASDPTLILNTSCYPYTRALFLLRSLQPLPLITMTTPQPHSATPREEFSSV